MKKLKKNINSGSNSFFSSGGKLPTKKGFSLVEVLVSLLILTLGIAGVLLLATSNTKTYVASKNQIIAAELAQEGIELIRNKKDNGQVFIGSADYIIDATSNIMSVFIPGPGITAQLYLDAANYYQHVSTTKPTKFYRKVNVAYIAAANQYQITSYVSWEASGSFASCATSSRCLSTTSIIPKDLN